MGTAEDGGDLHDPDDPDDPEDLDGHAAPSAGAAGGAGGGASEVPGLGRARWPRRVPAWARGPAGALVAAVVAAALSAVLTAGHVRAVETERRTTQAALLSLQAGAVTASREDRVLAGGLSAVEVVVPLANRGPRALEVSVLGLSTPGQQVTRPTAPVRVEPGTTVSVPVTTVVDCSRIAYGGVSPRADGLPTRPVASVAVRVALPAGPRRLDVPVIAAVSRALDADLASACHPSTGASTSTTWTYSPDGHVRISVRNDAPSGTPPLRLDLQQTPGLASSARPALPLTVPPGRTTQVDLAVDPDCAVVHDGYTSELHLVQVDDDGAVVADLSTGGFDPRTGVVTGTTAWLARQITEHCP